MWVEVLTTIQICLQILTSWLGDMLLFLNTYLLNNMKTFSSSHWALSSVVPQHVLFPGLYPLAFWSTVMYVRVTKIGALNVRTPLSVQSFNLELSTCLMPDKYLLNKQMYIQDGNIFSSGESFRFSLTIDLDKTYLRMVPLLKHQHLWVLWAYSVLTVKSLIHISSEKNKNLLKRVLIWRKTKHHNIFFKISPFNFSFKVCIITIWEKLFCSLY